MVTTSGDGAFPHHRQNRRRERPGSRTRRTLSRKGMQSSLEQECQEAILLARDANVHLPYDRPKPSPLLRENFDQSWQRWQIKKAKEAEEVAQAEIERVRLEQYQLELFGGDGCNDDEILRLGVFYENVDKAQNESNSAPGNLLFEHVAPMFVIRQGKPRRNRRAKPQSSPLYLSFSDFCSDDDSTRPLSPSHPQTLIQHHDITLSMNVSPQSLPEPRELESLHFLDSYSLSGDWTFIETTLQTPKVTTPSSEPETWILLGDDL